ncbi:MAG: hypothetical protein CND84_01435 [Marine Group II euryarchaeote MED-G35]|nr:MAG: hypothetical protein CND84_01435 [Marine Group II euryarchaeote MED-G35]
MVDVMLHLVDRGLLDEIMSMKVEDISSAMEGSSLRASRPEADPRFHRDFDVDLEGEVLELIDGSADIGGVEQLSQATDDASMELRLLLAKWCSSAQWRCWEARLFLYVEPMLESPVEDSDDFLLPGVWDQFSEALSSTDRSSYSESVVLDWMSRREDMGETMEPAEDPMILPTMESHRTLSESLFNIMESLRRSEMELMAGREFLEAGGWMLGRAKLSEAWGSQG